jgi:drug/metabolite transporter (DMT)-like permease
MAGQSLERNSMVEMIAASRQDRPLAGIALMLVAFLVFSFIDASAKWLSTLSLPAMQLAFMRYLPHFLISTSLVGSAGLTPASFASPHMPMLILRALFLMIATVLNFVAMTFLPLTLTSTILFSAPLIICMLSWPLLGERVGTFRWSAIALGFAGVAIAIRPFDDNFHWAVLLSLGGAFSFALYSILTRRLAGQVSIDVMQFYTGAIGTAALLPVAIWQWRSPQTVIDWTILIMLGVFGWGGHQFMTVAHRFAAASLLTPFGYSLILYLTAWSYVLFGHVPDKVTVSGAALIVASGLVIWFRELQQLQVRRA